MSWKWISGGQHIMKISVWTAVSADFGQRQNLQIPAAGTVHFSEHIIIKKQRKEWITAAFCNKNVKMYYKNLIKISPGKRLIFSLKFPKQAKGCCYPSFFGIRTKTEDKNET